MAAGRSCRSMSPISSKTAEEYRRQTLTVIKEKILDTIVSFDLWSEEGVLMAMEDALLAHPQAGAPS
eukprot:752434-Hanusia_phi.AAC.1